MNRYFCAIVFAATSLIAQTPKADMTPKPTDYEAAMLENFDLKISPVYQQMQFLQQQRMEFIQKMNKNHPGYMWHDAQSKDDVSGFVPAPKPQSAKNEKSPAK